MKSGIKLLTASFLMFSGSVQSQDLNVSVIAYKDCHPSINTLDFMAKPSVCNMSSQAITFMIRGKNIAVIDEDSLRFSKLEVRGEDVRYNRKGDNLFVFGPFPKIEENGEYAIFDVELKSAPFGHIGSTSLAGTIDIMTSKRVINEERKAIGVDKSFSIDVGPLTLSNQPKQKPSKPKPGGLINEVDEALSDGLKSAFLGNESDSLVIYVNGSHESLVSLEVYEDDKKLEPGWYTTSGDERQITFAKPTGSKINLKLKYWDGLQRVTVPITL